MGKIFLNGKGFSEKKTYLVCLKNDIYILAHFQQDKCVVGIVGRKAHF